jgi:hypothetical protein
MSSNLKAEPFFETLGTDDLVTRGHIPEDDSLQVAFSLSSGKKIE